MSTMLAIVNAMFLYRYCNEHLSVWRNHMGHNLQQVYTIVSGLNKFFQYIGDL